MEDSFQFCRALLCLVAWLADTTEGNHLDGTTMRVQVHMYEVFPKKLWGCTKPLRACDLKKYIRFTMGRRVFQIRADSIGEPWVPRLFSLPPAKDAHMWRSWEMKFLHDDRAQHTVLNYYSPNRPINPDRVRVRLPWMRGELLPEVTGGTESGMGPRQSVVTRPRVPPLRLILLARP